MDGRSKESSVSSLKPMDIYSSRMDIPFDVAAFCRGRKLSPEAVELSRALQSLDAADTQLTAAQILHDNAVERFRAAVRSVQEKITKDGR